jgi:hypothetical protein
MENKTILMGSENHNGWKLEDLLAQVKLEVSQKINKIINDPSPQAQLVVRNNLAIIEHLGSAEALQRSSGIVLDALRPNEGPTGIPRIGEMESIVREKQPKKREDLIGLGGSVTRHFEVVDACEYPTGIDIRISENETGHVYWTSIDEVEIDQ